MWNERYSAKEYAYGTEPNTFLAAHFAHLPKGRVLSLAEGEGRNAVFLAQQGYAVTAVDGSQVGLYKAQALAELARKHQAKAVPVSGVGYADLGTQIFDVVFNATSASLTAELPPLSATVFAPGCLAYELAYGKGLTPFLKLASQAGVTRMADGVGMLAEQAAEAFLWWRGVRPDTRAVIDTLTVPLV